MRFLITRTSGNHDNFYNSIEKPCENSIGMQLVGIHQSVPEGWWKDRPRELKVWESSGRNHRVVDGYEARDENIIVWFIELDSIEDLLDLIKTEGQIVVNANTKKRYDKFYLQDGTLYQDYDGIIEIYDDYRE